MHKNAKKIIGEKKQKRKRKHREEDGCHYTKAATNIVQTLNIPIAAFVTVTPGESTAIPTPVFEIT